MSFILDALKKSENDRQRQTGPALFEVRVAPPKSKFPLLAVSIVSLLVVNLAVVGWLMLRKPAVAATPETIAAPATGAPQTQVQAAGVQPTQSGAAIPQPQVPNGMASQGYAPGSQQGYPAPNGPALNGQGYPPPNGQGYPPQGGQYGPPQQQAYSQQPGDSQPAYGAATRPPANTYGQPNSQPAGNYGYQGAREPSLAGESGGTEPLNPDDYAPARDAPPPGKGEGRVVQSTESGLPTYEEAATRITIPPIHMDLHSYAPDPSKRFVLINMKRLYEGQSLPEGVKVESITNDAAIMSYNGTRFVLDSD